MKKQDLDALAGLYESVYGAVQLNEIPYPVTRQEKPFRRGDPETDEFASARRYQVTPGKGYPSTLNGRRGYVVYGQSGKGKFTEYPNQPAPPPPRPAGSTIPPRPTGPVLSKKNDVEGTGVGANFKARAFTTAEKSRFASVAAQNAARNSTTSGTQKPPASTTTPSASAPKPPTPAIGKLGNTPFERRTPTSAELRAAQRARAGGASPEQALQAAQKTNLPTTGPTPAIPDKDLIRKQGLEANKPENLNKLAPQGTALRNFQEKNPTYKASTSTQTATTSINNNKTTMNQSYEWPSAKTIRDIAGAYASIYEAKKEKQNPWWDDDGDGIGYEEGEVSSRFKKKKKKKVKEEFEYWVDSLIEEGYDLSDYTWDEMYDYYINEGLGSAIKRLFGGKKPEPEAPKPESRGAYLRRKYNVGPDRSDTSAKRQILDRSRARKERDQQRYGGSPYTQSIAQQSADAHDRYLRAGYSKYGATHTAGRANPNQGRGSRARRRASSLSQAEAYEVYKIVASYLLENNFAETLNDANVIIENMSDKWFIDIMEDAPLRDKPLW